MTIYSDVPQAQALISEQNQITQVIANLDAGGAIIALTVGPGEAGGLNASATLPGPTAPGAAAATRGMLTLRYNELTDQLAALGVTDLPPAMSLAVPGRA